MESQGGPGGNLMSPYYKLNLPTSAHGKAAYASAYFVANSARPCVPSSCHDSGVNPVRGDGDVRRQGSALLRVFCRSRRGERAEEESRRKNRTYFFDALATIRWMRLGPRLLGVALVLQSYLASVSDKGQGRIVSWSHESRAPVDAPWTLFYLLGYESLV